MSHSFADAGHLPHRRSAPADPAGLPRQRRGTTPQMHGRYPDYDVLADARHWDDVTRQAILARASEVPTVRFFDEREARTARAFCDTVMAQDRDPRIPVMEMVDAKLFEGRLDGFRYADMPDDRDTWHQVLAALDDAAGPGGLATVPDARRRAIVDGFAHGDLRVDLDVGRAWSVLMRAVLEAFYSHPWAWNEIGFGGPA